MTESGTSNQKVISALMSQVSFRRETIGGIINYWLFPQAKDFLKEIWKFCEFSSLCPKNGKVWDGINQSYKCINKYFALTWFFYVTSFQGIGDSSQGFANFVLFFLLTDHIRKKIRLCCVLFTPWYQYQEKDPLFESKKFPLNETSDFSSNSYGAGDCISVYSMNYTA